MAVGLRNLAVGWMPSSCEEEQSQKGSSIPGFFLSLVRSTAIPSLCNSDVPIQSVWHPGFRFYMQILLAQFGARTKDRLRIVSTLKDIVICWVVVVVCLN